MHVYVLTPLIVSIVRPDMLNGWVANMDENPDQKQVSLRSSSDSEMLT